MALVAAVLAPACASAQHTIVDSVQNRNDCRLAAQVLTEGVPRTKFKWAASSIHTCPQAGVALASALARTSPGSTDEEVVIASANLLDDRHLLLAGVSLLEDPAVPVLKQLAALRVLVPLVNQRYRVDTTRYESLEWGILAGQLDGDPAPTASPVTAADRAAALSAIEAAGTRDTTRLAGRVAASIGKTLRLLEAPR